MFLVDVPCVWILMFLGYAESINPGSVLAVLAKVKRD